MLKGPRRGSDIPSALLHFFFPPSTAAGRFSGHVQVIPCCLRLSFDFFAPYFLDEP